MAIYILNAINRAWHKSFTGLGWGINIILAVLMLLIYFLINLSTFDAKIALALVIFVFIWTFINYTIWEMQAIFVDVKIMKRNTMDGAEIVIWNNEIVDLVELEVQLLEMIWVTEAGGAVPIPIDPGNRFFDLRGFEKVSYGGGSKVVLLASGDGGNATFHMKTTELDTGHESDGKADRSKYEIVIQLKGKINERPIFPKTIKGILKYTRTPQEFRIPSQGSVRLLNNVYSKMEWEDL